jgi:hypothetical protein
MKLRWLIPAERYPKWQGKRLAKEEVDMHRLPLALPRHSPNESTLPIWTFIKSAHRTTAKVCIHSFHRCFSHSHPSAAHLSFADAHTYWCGAGSDSGGTAVGASTLMSVSTCVCGSVQRKRCIKQRP